MLHIAGIPRRRFGHRHRHPRRHPREDRRENVHVDVGVGAGVVEYQLMARRFCRFDILSF